MWVSCLVLFYAVGLHSVFSSFEIISLRKRDRNCCFTLFCSCHVLCSFLCFVLVVPRAGMQCVIVAFPGHTHLFFVRNFAVSSVIVVAVMSVQRALSALTAVAVAFSVS